MPSCTRRHCIPNASCLGRFVLIALMLSSTLSAQDAALHFPGKSWQRYRRVEDAGFSPTRLYEAVHEANTHDIAGLLVVHNGTLVLRYGDIETRYMCHSIRKSLMSLMYGMVDIDIQKTLAELGIDDVPPLTDQEKQATVADLLKSRSGIYHPAAYEPASMKQSRPERGIHEPGEHWWYNNWDFNALLTIFEQETGQGFFDAFHSKIAEPLQLEDFRPRDGYYHRESSSVHPAYPFRMSARDLARIGWLVAARGQWKGKSVVPADWIHESTRPHSTFDPWNRYHAYGFMWWIGEHQDETVISALGTGNQSVDVLPDRKLVFVFRANTFKGKSIDQEDRWAIINSVLAAQDLVPKTNPERVDVPEVSPIPAELKTLPTPGPFLDSLPVDLPRLLPATLPKSIRDQRLRITLEAAAEDSPQLVLFTGPPPTMQFDLYPVGTDRFWVEGLNEIGVVQRNEDGTPKAFLLQGDLIASLQAARASNESTEVQLVSQLLKEHFAYHGFDRGEEISAGMRKLVELMEEGQKWPYEGVHRVDGAIPLPYELGGTSLVCLALLYGADNGDDETKTAFENGLAFILGNIDDPRMATSAERRYDTRVLAQAYTLLLLSHVRKQLPDHPKRDAIDAGIHQLTDSLVAEQMDDGGWNYQGRPFHASFVTASVVEALAHACGTDPSIAHDLRKQRVFEQATRALDSSRFPDGGFRYFGTHDSQTARPPQDLLPGSIARAPICESMLYLLGTGSVNRIQRSIDAFHRHWNELEARRQKPGTHDGPFLIAPYYFYYGHRYVAQAIELLPESRRPAERERLDQLLMRTRSEDGTWNDRVFPRSRSYSTAMVMLALMSDRIGPPPELPVPASADTSPRVENETGEAPVMVKNVYVMFPDNTVRNVSPTPNAGFYGGGCIHPDGANFIFQGAERGFSRIWKYDCSTGGVSALTPDSYASINPAYSSDGKRIVFVADRDLDNPRFDMFEVGRTKPHDAGFQGGITSASNLYVMDADVQNIRQLTKGEHFDTRPSFSPDGKTVVFLSSRDSDTLHIWKVAADGSSAPERLEMEGDPWAGRPCYSNDGAQIFFFTGITDGQYDPQGRHTLCCVPATGGAWHALPNDSVGRASHGPFPAPTGDQLWYHALYEERWGIYRLSLNGGEPRRWVPAGFDRAQIAHPTESRNGFIGFDSRSFVDTANQESKK